MTLLFMEGFETGADETDFSARGLLNNLTVLTGYGNSLAMPSRTGYPGKGLYLRGPYSSSGAYAMNGAGYPDFGMFQINQSVYALWQNGGFAVGFSAAFNSLNYLEIAPGESQQLVYDGNTYYWAITRNGNSGVYGVAYSTDLKNWTQTLSVPGVNQNSTITVNGSGLNALVIVGSSSNLSAPVSQYSTNMGLSWNTMSNNVLFRTPIYLNGSTAMYVTVTANGSVGMYPAYATTLTSTPVQLNTVSLAPLATIEGAFCKQSGNYLFAVANSGGSSQWQPSSGVTTGVGYCLANADPTVAGNWTVLPKLPFCIMDVAYYNGYVVAVGYGGAYYISLASPTTWLPAQGFQNGAFSFFAVASNGSMLVAVGQDALTTSVGAIYTSTDGVHWTKLSRFFDNAAAAANTAANAYTCVLWDGTQFIVTAGLNSGMIITSKDGQAWEPVYVTDYLDTNTGSGSYLSVMTGTIGAGNVWSPWNLGATAAYTTMFGVYVNNSNGTTRTLNVAADISAGLSYGTAFTMPAVTPPLGQQPGASLTHYYELVATAVAGTPNLFTLTCYIDGQQQAMPAWGNLYLAAPADRGTTQLFVNLPRAGAFNQIDDIYVTNMDGHGSSGRLGPQNIFLLAGKTATQAQFNNTIGTNTNPQTVSTELTNAEGSIYATTQGAEDIYTNSNTVPANYLVKAVQVDAYLSSQGLGPGVAGAVGVVSAGTAKNGTATSAGAGWQNRATLLIETDPATGAAFTNAALNAMNVTITKTT